VAGQGLEFALGVIGSGIFLTCLFPAVYQALRRKKNTPIHYTVYFFLVFVMAYGIRYWLGNASHGMRILSFSAITACASTFMLFLMSAGRRR